jgi:septal ring factor EnvC (AmiA/AmiB activator)
LDAAKDRKYRLVTQLERARAEKGAELASLTKERDALREAAAHHRAAFETQLALRDEELATVTAQLNSAVTDRHEYFRSLERLRQEKGKLSYW